MTANTPQRVDVARLSELLAVIASSNPDRRADYPGGCDCHECGCIFIGGDGHDYCAQCEAKRQLLAMLPEALPALLQQLADTAKKSDSRRVKLIKAQRQRRELHESIRMMAAEIALLRNGVEQEKLNLLTRLHAAERAREEVQRRYEWAANELLACDYGDNDRNEIGWRVYGWRSLKGRELRIYGPSIDKAIAAFLAANAPTHSAGGE